MFDTNSAPSMSVSASCGDAAPSVGGEALFARFSDGEEAGAAIRGPARELLVLHGSHPTAAPHDALVNLVRSYVLAHIGRPISTAELLVITGTSESTLCRTVVSETGTQLAQFILHVRLERAHALLSTNRESRSVGQLALALGFGSPAIFSRSYRKRFGEAVSETRRRTLANSDSVPDGLK